MANSLTGDFDVVAEFSLPAVNRVLAAMHQCERLLHSIAVRVDDTPPRGPMGQHPTAVGVVDAFGDALANPRGIRIPPNEAAGTATAAVLAGLGAIVNRADLVANAGQITPSNLKGVAQIQLYAPTVSIPPQPNSITITTNVLARYFPDKDTSAIAEYMRGDISITAPMNKIASGRLHLLNIDFKADDAVIRFTPSYSSSPLAPEDLAAISLCIQNGLRTSFLPSSVTLPGTIADAHLKTLPGAVAVMLNLNSHAASVGSVNNVFVGAGEDFGFAAGRDYVFSALRPVVDNILAQPPIHITVTFGYHFSFEITLNSASFDLQPGKILLSIKAHAKPLNHTWVGSADFTISVEFFLQPSGNTVQLGVGNVSISFDSSLSGAFAGLADYFTGNVTASVKDAVMNALDSANAFAIVDRTFNTDTNLAQFLNAQLAPSDGSAVTDPQQISLMYTAADVQQDGIVLRGLLLLRPWPDAYVQYEPVPAHVTSNLHNLPGEEQDYSALKTWIPGGRVDQYEWSYQGQSSPFEIDANKFVLSLDLVHADPGPVMARTVALAGYSPLCLTVRGTRVRNYGPGDNPQPVFARVCGYRRFPLLPGVLVNATAVAPMMALTHPGPNGKVSVTGHAEAQTGSASSGTPNVLIHFADAKTAAQLKALTNALERLNKKKAATAIIGVVSRPELDSGTYVPGISYSEDSAAWQAVLGIKSAKKPFTAIVSPMGKIVWQKDGLPDENSLADALKQHLTPTAPVRIATAGLKARIGQSAPNFVFEFVSGREMPLSKLRGRPVTIVFWKASSSPSVQAVRAAQAGDQAQNGVVLAVNDGDPAGVAHGIAAENGFSEALVCDANRAISSAYGVNLWPTIVSLNANGAITSIRFGFGTPDQRGTVSPAQKKQ
jgi:AhpC/TSA family protein